MSTIVWIRGKAQRITSADDSVVWIRGAPNMVVEEKAVLRAIRMVFTVVERVDMTFKLHEVK